MQELYYINKNQQENGDFEVHQFNNCPHPAAPINQISLGLHHNCYSAVSNAKSRFPNQSHNINGCYWCCNPCHTS